MPLSPGARLGPYEILSALGAGGMGEVYRARDTKLGRDVAIKVLPDHLADDSDRIARFEREAKALAALNHPRIATLYGLEVSDGRHLLIMELVEGETLADRIARGLLPLEEVLRTAIQIADALEAAHEKAIVHRDLKPANVKITPDGNVKVLDFGLARLGPGETGGSAGSLTHSPTLSMMGTQAGVLLGTAAYMSPEQAKGLAADHRSDVFSFGVVLYEMLTRRQPFQGETAPDILASVLAREPNLAALPAGLNPRLPELIKRCLEKHPKRRWQAVGDLRAELEAVAAAPHAQTVNTIVAAPPQPFWKRAIPTVVTALAATAITSAAWLFFGPQTPPATVARFAITLPEGQPLVQNGQQLIGISPDGTQIAYWVNGRLYLRSMSEFEPKTLVSPESLDTPLAGAATFSPDGRSLAFWTGSSTATGALKRIAVTGGAAVTICQATFPYGMSWGRDGILFGQQNKGIMRVSPNGGQPEQLIPVKEGVAWGPQMLPDGDTVLFTLATTITGLSGATTDSWDKAHIVAQSLKSGVRKTLIEGGLGARALPSGHIVYALSGVLFAVPFDFGRLQPSGSAVPIVEGIRRPVFPGAAPGTVYFGVSDTGSLIFIPGPAAVSSNQADLAFFDRQGSLTRLKLQPGPYASPRISPDGTRVVFGREDSKGSNVWIYDLSGTSSMRQLTFGGKNRDPVWSADGQRVAFQSDREKDLAIFWQRADGSGTAERLTKPDPEEAHVPDSWSADGKTLLVDTIKNSRFSLWMLSLPDRKLVPVGDIHSGVPTTSTFSHDGRWFAYTSNEGGPAAIFVQPFPLTGAKNRIAVGTHPLWSPDGKQLSYTLLGQYQIVNVTTQPSFTFGNPTPIPAVPAFGNNPSAPTNYDITPDGRRFIMVTQAGQSPSGAPTMPQIHVVLHWLEELKTRVPTR
jgi:serine/threonine protein kinase/Tol biopolymer transport system component